MTARIEGGQVPPIHLPLRLQIARDFAGLNQTQLADIIGVSRNTITNAECGRFTPRKIVLHAWALATGVARWWLLGEEQQDSNAVAQVEPSEAPQPPQVSKALARVEGRRLGRRLAGPPSKHHSEVQQTHNSFAYAQKPVGWAETCVILPAGISRGEKVA